MSWHTLGDVIAIVHAALLPRIGAEAASLAVALLVNRFDAMTVTA